MIRSLTLMLFVLVLGLLPSVPAMAQMPSSPPSPWKTVPGTAVDIAINTEGQGYVVSPDGTPWRWDKAEQRWRRMSGKFVRITAAEGNRPWAIDGDGVVYRYNGLWWEDKDTDVIDIATDANANVYIVKVTGEIKSWYALRSEWRPIDGRARRIALDGAGHPWIVTLDGRVRSFNGRTWMDYPGRAIDIAIGGTDVAVIVDARGRLRRWNGEEKLWQLIDGVSGVRAAAVTPEGGVWAVLANGVIMANGALGRLEEEETKDKAKTPKASEPKPTERHAEHETPSVPVAPVSTVSVPTASSPTASTTSPGTLSSRVAGLDPARVSFRGAVTFVNTRKSISTIAIGGDGSVFGLDAGGNVLRWSNGEKKFNSFDGRLVRLAVDRDGNPWGVSALGRVFYHDGKRWSQIEGFAASDIAIGYDGTVLIVDGDGQLAKLNAAKTQFKKIKGLAAAVAVGPDGVPWGIRSDKLVERCDTSPCTVLKQKALSLSVGPDGSVWIISNLNKLMRLKNDGKTFETIETPGHTPWKVAVGPNGYPWVVSDARLALAAHFFDRDESGDTSVAAASSGDTTGTGDTTAVTTTTASAFTFSKNMQFETLTNGDLTVGDSDPDLVAAVDGTMYAHNGAKFFTYNTATKKFETLSTQIATNGYTISNFGAASNEDIWAAVDIGSGQMKLYRERNKVLKEYSVSGLTISRVTVGPDDMIYADFYTGGTHYIYTKSSGSEVFKKFKQVYGYGMAVGPGNDVWIIDGSNYVYQWTGSKFEKRPASGQTASKISISKTAGTVYILDTSNVPRKWNSSNQSFDKINNITGTYIAVDDQGRPWINTDSTPTIKRAKD